MFAFPDMKVMDKEAVNQLLLLLIMILRLLKVHVQVDISQMDKETVSQMLNQKYSVPVDSTLTRV
jgi:hypothetical protein